MTVNCSATQGHAKSRCYVLVYSPFPPPTSFIHSRRLVRKDASSTFRSAAPQCGRTGVTQVVRRDADGPDWTLTAGVRNGTYRQRDKCAIQDLAAVHETFDKRGIPQIQDDFEPPPGRTPQPRIVALHFRQGWRTLLRSQLFRTILDICPICDLPDAALRKFIKRIDSSLRRIVNGHEVTLPYKRHFVGRRIPEYFATLARLDLSARSPRLRMHTKSYAHRLRGLPRLPWTFNRAVAPASQNTSRQSCFRCLSRTKTYHILRDFV